MRSGYCLGCKKPALLAGDLCITCEAWLENDWGDDERTQ